MAIPFLPYRKPALFHHTDALVPPFQRKGISRILLVTDPIVRFNQIAQPLERALQQAGMSCIVYDQTVSNPTTDQVEEARALYNAHHCQAIIGFGGGSSIDCAKAVGAWIARLEKHWTKWKAYCRYGKSFLSSLPSPPPQAQAVKPHWQQSSPTAVPDINIPSMTLY